MLAIWKFINRDKETGPNVQILTPDFSTKEYTVGILLSSNKEDTTISSSTTTYTFVTTVDIKVSGASFFAGTSRNGKGKYKVTQEFTSNNDSYGKEQAVDARREFIKEVDKLIINQYIKGGNVGNLTITPLEELKVTETHSSTSNNIDTSTREDVTNDETKYTEEAKIIPSKSYTKRTKPNHYYIRFGALLEYIEKNIIIKIKNKDTDPIFKIDTSEWNTYMYSLPNQISLDPRVCIVRNNQIEVGKSKKSSAFTKLNYFKLVDNGSKNDNVAYTLNIYLNFDFVQECLKADDKGNVSVYQLISNICTGLNKALGGINNLEPIIDESSNTLKIIDTTPIPGYSAADNGPGYKLQIYGYDKLGNNYISNFVRKVDLKTAITPEYATMITVGATAGGYVKGVEATAFSKWNTGLTDRFKEEFLPTPNVDVIDENEADINYIQTFIIDGFANRYGLTYFGENKKLSDNIIEKNISVVTEYYKWLIAKNAEGKSISGGTVGHRLNGNDWETSIEATVMPKTGEMALVAITAEIVAASIKENIGFKPSRWPYYSPNDAVPLDIESPSSGTPPTSNANYSVNSTIKTKYIPELKKINGTKGLKMLALIIAQKEGYYSNTKSYRTNNPGNIGNTDTGATNSFPTLKAGIQGQFDYISRVVKGKHASYPLGKNKNIPPYYSPEIANNIFNYNVNPYLPGYKFTPYRGTLEQFIKIYSTAARGSNGYLSGIISFFHKNGFTNVTEKTTLQELIKLNNSTPIIV